MADSPLANNDVAESPQRSRSIESSGAESRMSMTLNDEKLAGNPSHGRDTDISMTDVEQDKHPQQRFESKMHDVTKEYSESPSLSRATEKSASLTRYLHEDSDRIKSQQMNTLDFENRSTKP